MMSAIALSTPGPLVQPTIDERLGCSMPTHVHAIQLPVQLHVLYVDVAHRPVLFDVA